jgi:hypothetical protein
MMIRNAVIVCAALSAAASPLQLPAQATDRDPGHIIIHKGDGGQNLAAGSNFLDNSARIGCWHREGCVLNVTTMLEVKPDGAARVAICTYVDGSCIDPDGGSLSVNSAIAYQSTWVGRGWHTIQTGLTNSRTATLGPWEVNYELYEHRRY